MPNTINPFNSHYWQLQEFGLITKTSDQLNQIALENWSSSCHFLIPLNPVNFDMKKVGLHWQQSPGPGCRDASETPDLA